MLVHGLSVFAFIVVSFTIQASSHLVINKAHYDAVTYIREEPIFLGGLVAMIVQGVILTFMYTQVRNKFAGIKGGVGFSVVMGGFLASYITLAEPSKYVVPSFWGWFRLELSVSAVQFILFGILLGYIHKKWQS